MANLKTRLEVLEEAQETQVLALCDVYFEVLVDIARWLNEAGAPDQRDAWFGGTITSAELTGLPAELASRYVRANEALLPYANTKAFREWMANPDKGQRLNGARSDNTTPELGDLADHRMAVREWNGLYYERPEHEGPPIPFSVEVANERHRAWLRTPPTDSERRFTIDDLADMKQRGAMVYVYLWRNGRSECWGAYDEIGRRKAQDAF